jgi:capsular polysaccharide biosynthesis protein
MVDSVYILENRGISWIGHWFLYIIAGLKDLYRFNTKPVKIHIQGIPYTKLHSYQQETLDLISAHFEYIDDPTPYTQIPHHGTPLLKSDLTPEPYYIFLKIILDEAFPYDYTQEPRRLIYISRNGAEQRRQIVNEKEVYEVLQKLGFEYIRLETLGLKEKLTLFRQAKCIVSPNGAGLVMAHWAHPKTHIIEIHDPKTSGEDHHLNTCRILNIPFTRYTNVRSVDIHGYPMHPFLTGSYNLIINDIGHFQEFISQIC